MSFPIPVPTDIDLPYWEAGRDGVLRMQRCAPHDHLVFPPGRRCPVCGDKDLRWTDLRGRGRIWSWVVFHKAFFEGAQTPYTVVRVKLDEGPFLIANLVDSDGREPAEGAPVRVVFEPAGDIYLPQFTLV
jgi:uncharacterized OB-fold protein